MVPFTEITLSERQPQQVLLRQNILLLSITLDTTTETVET